MPFFTNKKDLCMILKCRGSKLLGINPGLRPNLEPEKNESESQFCPQSKLKSKKHREGFSRDLLNQELERTTDGGTRTKQLMSLWFGQFRTTDHNSFSRADVAGRPITVRFTNCRTDRGSPPEWQELWTREFLLVKVKAK